MRKSSIYFSTILLFISQFAFAQDNFFLQRIDPPYWFGGLKNDTLELLIKANGPEKLTFNLHEESKAYAQILSVEKSSLNNYYYIDLTVSAQPKENLIYLLINKAGSSKTEVHSYSILPKSYSPKGLHSSDAMYMVFPDRFANGNSTNDSIVGMHQQTNRKELKGRRGGDIEGISNHLNYIKDLGFTAIWINPMVENNEKIDSYHGYATTDCYQIDPRIGNFQDLSRLTSKMEKKELKHVWDIVYNHWGDQHHLFLSMPDSNWFHWFPEFTKTNYRAETMMDPYASEFDKNLMANGWFDKHMPDLNQQNPHVAKYLIQNSIWWIEVAKIDAFRMDTYSYPDQIFMSELNRTLTKEYPNLFTFGETWVQGSAVQAWFPEGKKINQSFDSHLSGVTDFQLFYALTKGLNEPFGWEEGLRRIELNLSHDHLYKNPENLVTFLDNHDLPRIYSVYNEDFNKWKIAHALLLTLRGIPCIYYGTEILMTGFCDPDAHVREVFPGGWKDHPVNAFEKFGRSDAQNEAYNFLKLLLEYRKENPWLTEGKLVQFVPNDNTYAYARTKDNKTLVCLYNLNETAFDYPMKNLQEITKGKICGKDIISGKTISWTNTLSIPAKGFYLVEISF